MSRLTLKQQLTLADMRKRKEILEGWISTELYDPRTIRSLLRRGLIEVSSDVPWMIEKQLHYLSVRVIEHHSTQGK